jgi:hypothetical protein
MVSPLTFETILSAYVAAVLRLDAQFLKLIWQCDMRIPKHINLPTTSSWNKLKTLIGAKVVTFPSGSWFCCFVTSLFRCTKNLCTFSSSIKTHHSKLLAHQFYDFIKEIDATYNEKVDPTNTDYFLSSFNSRSSW